ncbi:hypothetical protein GCM10009117_02350 [Gangjinia marincola]|uniref:Uncharacterized protein n=1 Tax=Gangjinia marincola TaxID=578463 RepID=A0ABP3XP63_9FLAO
MENTGGMTKTKASFQDRYRRSSNFGYGSPDRSLEIKDEEAGELKLTSSDDDSLSKEERKEIAEKMDKFRERIEQTPGGEQSDS